MTNSPPKEFWFDKRVVVTGGAGFLGSFVVEKLRERGATRIFVPRKAEYDLRQHAAILDLLHDTNPNIIIHLAASVGGIGANRQHPADFFYDNLWGDGSPTREFLYVEDAAEGILLATERYNESLPVNLGSSYEISIKALLETILRLTGFEMSPELVERKIVWDTSKPNGQPQRKLDTSRARRLFGFEARTPFEVGLKRTIEWYRREAR